MQQSFQLQQLAISLVAENLKPTAINLDFLQYSGIVDKSWELARPPVYTSQVAQLLFKNGFGIVAQPNQLMFVEACQDKALHELQVADIAKRCAQTLSSVTYKAIRINPRGYTEFSGSEAAAQEFVAQHLLAGGSWQSFAEEPPNASVQLSYALDDARLNLSIAHGSLRQSEDENVPVAVFGGNFDCVVTGDSSEEQLGQVQQLLDAWTQRVESFQALVEEHFLQEAHAPVAMTA